MFATSMSGFATTRHSRVRVIVARVIVMSWKGWAAAPQTGTYRGPSLIHY
jgi:hypothetical protein